MALFENGILKGSAKFALWGLGIYVGLRVVGPLLASAAKPLAKEAEKGYRSLRSKLQGSGQEGPPEEAVEAEIEIGGAAAVSEGIRTTVAAAASSPDRPVPLDKLKKQRQPAAKGRQPSARWSKADLYARAKELKIAGRSSMNKEELLVALKAAATPLGTA